MKSNILKISFINHLKSLWGFIYMTIGLFVVDYYISIKRNLPHFWLFSSPAIIIFIIFYGWLVFPAVILHINYYLKNRNKEYEISEDRMIVRDKQGNEKVYMKSDISKIIKCTNGGNIFVSYGDYDFIRLDMKNGEHIYLTSLLYPKSTIELKKIYFPDIPSYTVGRWICVTYGY